MITQATVSSSTFENLLRASISTANALPFQRVKKQMDGLVEHELKNKVQFPTTDAIMDIVIPTSGLKTEDLEGMNYEGEEENGRPVEGAAVFNGRTGWNLDQYNAPKSKKGGSQIQRKRKNQKHKQKQKQKQKQVVTEDEKSEGSQSTIFAAPFPTDQSADDREYQPGKAAKRRKLTTEDRWSFLFNFIHADMHSRLKHVRSSGSRPAPDIFPFRVDDHLPRRSWSSQFANTPVPDETNAQKPDLVLLDQGVIASTTTEITWADILTGVEITDTAFSKDAPVYLGIATKGYLMMREQPWRRFVVLFSIAAKYLRAHYFDRSGLIISRPIQIDKNPTRLVDMLNAMTLGVPEMLGFDPTIHMCNEKCTGTHNNLRDKAIGWILKPSALGQVTYSIMQVLWKSQGLFCRGTTCYRVQDAHGKEYALKDCWVDENKKRHEVDVLKMLAGTPNVVALVDEWDVIYDGEPDSTSRIRRHGGPLHVPEDYCNRCHRRILLTPCGKPLSTFSSKLQLLNVFHDFVTAHEMMVAKKVLHGDLSPNNLIIHDGRGYFIDFDHAMIIGPNETSVHTRGTGTLPYLSIRALVSIQENPTGTVLRSASDDLESLFYIFLEFINTHPMPGDEPDHNRSRLPWHTEDQVGNLLNVVIAKQGVLSGQASVTMMLVRPYFHSLRGVVSEWCILLNPGTKEPGSNQCITHEQLKAVLYPGMQSAHDERLPPPQGMQSTHDESLPPPQGMQSTHDELLPPPSPSSSIPTQLPTSTSGSQFTPRRNPRRSKHG